MLSLTLAALSETKFASPGQLARSQPYEENPFVDGDSTQECYQWAVDHECIKNPPHMLEQCKYSCWEWFEHRRQNYPDAKIDKKFHCHLWAKNGECIRNPAYMWATCKAACAALTYLDTDASCAGWAESGECEKNAAFMIDHCNKSCVDHVQKQRLTRGGCAIRGGSLCGEEVRAARSLGARSL